MNQDVRCFNNERSYIKELRTGYGRITCRLQKVLETLYNQQFDEAIEQLKKVQLFASEQFNEQMEKESVEESWNLMKECTKGIK
jgi:hypothetical protein